MERGRHNEDTRRSALGGRRPALGSQFVILATLLLATLIACERAGEEGGPSSPQLTPPAEALTGFVVGQVTTMPGAVAQQSIEGIDLGEVGRLFRAAVRDMPTFTEEGNEASPDAPTIDFTLEVSVGLGSADPPPAQGTGQSTEPDEDVAYAIVMLSAEGGAYRDPRYQFEVHGLYRERVAAGETPLQTAQRLISAGIDDLIEGLLAETAPRVADDATVVAMLDESDPDLLLPAIREVHRRRLLAAAPAIRAKLSADDVEVIIAAVTTLGRLRDADAVTPLIDLISREHRELKELVLPILGEIDTVAARSYLQAVVDDEYEHPAIRQLARDILEQNLAVPR